MKVHQFPNDGYVVGNLTEELFDTLLIESLSCETNNPVHTALTATDGTQTCPHYEVSSDNSEKLANFYIHTLSFLWRILIILIKIRF